MGGLRYLCVSGILTRIAPIPPITPKQGNIDEQESNRSQRHEYRSRRQQRVMLKNLSRLIIRTLDELSHIRELQELIEMALEQGEQPTDKRISRVELLVEVYRCQMEYHLHEMQAAVWKECTEFTRRLTLTPSLTHRPDFLRIANLAENNPIQKCTIQ